MENKINLSPSLNPYLVKFTIAQKNLACWEKEVYITKRRRLKQKPIETHE